MIHNILNLCYPSLEALGSAQVLSAILAALKSHSIIRANIIDNKFWLYAHTDTWAISSYEGVNCNILCSGVLSSPVIYF